MRFHHHEYSYWNAADRSERHRHFSGDRHGFHVTALPSVSWQMIRHSRDVTATDTFSVTVIFLAIDAAFMSCHTSCFHVTSRAVQRYYTDLYTDRLRNMESIAIGSENDATEQPAASLVKLLSLRARDPSRLLSWGSSSFGSP